MKIQRVVFIDFFAPFSIYLNLNKPFICKGDIVMAQATFSVSNSTDYLFELHKFHSGDHTGSPLRTSGVVVIFPEKRKKHVKICVDFTFFF